MGVLAVNYSCRISQNRILAWFLASLTLAGLSTWSGCGKSGSEYNVAPVTGTITFNGEPVKGGSISLRPITQVEGKDGVTGRPASGTVGDDGTFTLSTYGNEDGAVIGKHKVSYLPVIKGAESYDDKPAPSPYAGLKPKTEEVEITAGENELNIELVKGS